MNIALQKKQLITVLLLLALVVAIALSLAILVSNHAFTHILTTAGSIPHFLWRSSP
ncbi:hypothetical protein [Thermogemmatispora sp.]|uniref:hypothetical protein n=1 Tax=Thermogemmatispora sp. TaxID=1968838 RepID=UPI001D60ABE8|nr:hypothetical protein [Thermogemmatispora sp.]MBX5451431.1 hypothetical protein [Thermogemmatispora sp.]